jgi:V-type H+-transporting ATPase subunit a
VTAPF